MRRKKIHRTSKFAPLSLVSAENPSTEWVWRPTDSLIPGGGTTVSQMKQMGRCHEGAGTTGSMNSLQTE